MVIVEFIQNHFKTICASISALGSIYGMFKKKTPVTSKSSNKVSPKVKIGKLDRSMNKQNKPTFNFIQVNININK